jgi:hypothetical protein
VTRAPNTNLQAYTHSNAYFYCGNVYLEDFFEIGAGREIRPLFVDAAEHKEGGPKTAALLI